MIHSYPKGTKHPIPTHEYKLGPAYSVKDDDGIDESYLGPHGQEMGNSLTNIPQGRGQSPNFPLQTQQILGKSAEEAASIKGFRYRSRHDKV